MDEFTKRVLAIAISSGWIAAATPPDKLVDLERAWTNEQSLLLAVTDVDRDADASEAYADWSAALNDFGSEAGDRFVVATVTLDELEWLVGDPGACAASGSAVFLDIRRGSFCAPGPVLDPDVYHYVDRLYRGEAIPAALRPVAPARANLVVYLDRRSSC